MKSLYYQFVNYIQSMDKLWFTSIWVAMFCVCLILIMKFFKIYNGTQKKFEKLSYIVVAILLFAALVFLTSIRQ